VYVSTGGALGFHNDALAATINSTVAPGPGWHAIELHLFVNGTSSLVEVWLDGVAVPDLTLGNTSLGTAPIGVLQIGDTATTGTWDVVLDDAAFGTSRLGPRGDTAPPSVPANVAATATSPFSVQLSWDASTDDVGVTGYDVIRDSNVLATVGTPGYTDNAVLAGEIHQYTVRARDASGNISALSASVGVMTPDAAAPVFADGFESADGSAWTTVTGLSVVSSDTHSGGFAAEGNPAAGAGFAKKTLPSTYTDVYARVAFKVKGQTSALTLIRLRDAPSGTSGGLVALTTAGKLLFRDAAGASTTSSVIPGPGWHVLELHLNITSGVVEVWLDGAAISDLRPSAPNLGTVAMGSMQIGDTASGTWDVLFDDAALGTSRLGVR